MKWLPQATDWCEVPISVHLLASIVLSPSTSWIGKGKGGTEKCRGETSEDHESWRVRGAEAGTSSGKGGQNKKGFSLVIGGGSLATFLPVSRD